MTARRVPTEACPRESYSQRTMPRTTSLRPGGAASAWGSSLPAKVTVSPGDARSISAAAGLRSTPPVSPGVRSPPRVTW